jgi:hypothetical protein
MLQTEFAFTLPCGYVDDQGGLHLQGAMRRATALDEIEPLNDPRVRANEAYLSILLLSRVVRRIGEIRSVTPAVIEGLFAPDFVYLQELYTEINTHEHQLVETECPRCSARFLIDLGHEDG